MCVPARQAMMGLQMQECLPLHLLVPAAFAGRIQSLFLMKPALAATAFATIASDGKWTRNPSGLARSAVNWWRLCTE